jgi:CDGSH-type Zn-finger protein
VSGVGEPAPTPPPLVEIKVRDDGPYKVTGPVRIVDAEGGEFVVEAGRAVALCRCGLSATKPFCDRAHREGGFRSCERAPG